jgi:hypothetical protein
MIPKCKGNPETVRRFEMALSLSPLPSYLQWWKASGIPRSSFFYAKYGQTIPHAELALKIARAAGTTVEFLWGHLLEDEQPPVKTKRKKTIPRTVTAAQGCDAEPKPTTERTTAHDTTRGV